MSSSVESFKLVLKWKDGAKEVNDLFNGNCLDPSVEHLHRQIEAQYKELSLPPQVKRAVVVTHVVGGWGDLAAAGRVIDLILKIAPTLDIDWVIMGGRGDKPARFLSQTGASKINIAYPLKECKKAQLLITGPAKTDWGTKYIESHANFKLDGPRFNFWEAGTLIGGARGWLACTKMEKGSDWVEVYQALFPAKSCSLLGPICMGLTPGSGIFFDKSRVEAKLSRGHFCPNRFDAIQDKSLRSDLEMAKNSEKVSFNFGYAHRPRSWWRFIQCVAIQEQKRDVVIALRQHGEFNKPSIDEWHKEVIVHAMGLGYAAIRVKGETESRECKIGESGRTLTIVLRPSFHPHDVKQMQLAAERLMATGMNSPAESWAARCSLFLYEDVSNGGVTDQFLKQQIAVAKEVSPLLAEFLELGGKISDYSATEQKRFEELLCDPNLSTATLKFCNHVVKKYRFESAFLGSLKRTVWHHYRKNLMKVETEALGKKFQERVTAYLKDFSLDEKLEVTGIEKIKNAISR